MKITIHNGFEYNSYGEPTDCKIVEIFDGKTIHMFTCDTEDSDWLIRFINNSKEIVK